MPFRHGLPTTLFGFFEFGRPFRSASNDFTMAAARFRRFERTLPTLSLVWSNGGSGSKQGRIRPVGAGDGGTPKAGAVEVCGSPNPIEVAEWLPSNVWSAWRMTFWGKWDGWGVLLTATLFGLVVVLGTWRFPRLISTKNGRVAFRIYGFRLCLFAESVCGGGPTRQSRSIEWTHAGIGFQIHNSFAE